MSALSARLDRVAAKIPPPAQVAQAPTGSLKMSFDAIVAKSIADAAFLETASPLERYKFHKEKIKRREAALAEAEKPTDNTLHKVRKVAIPSFLEDSRRDLHQAELDILREAGFTNHSQPGAQSCLDDILFDA